MDSHSGKGVKSPPKRLLLYGAIALGILAAPAFSYLWTNHKSHILEYLPFFIILLCPILHFFHHGKHGKGH